MDLRQLRYFIAIAEEKNITQAAARLHMAQPPLSQQLKQMEFELDTQLVEREARVTHLTKAGEVLYQEALKILQQVEETQLLVKETSVGLKGELNIGVNTLSAKELAPALVRYQKKYPAVTFAIHQNESKVLCEMVRQRKIELALIRFPLELSDFDVQFIQSEPFYFICDGSMKQGPAPNDYYGIADSKLVLPSTEGLGVYHSIIEYLAKFQLNPASISTCSDLTLLFDLVAAGFGTSIVPESVLNQYSHIKIEAHLLQDPLFQTSYGLIWLKDKSLTKLAQQFLTELTPNEVDR
ncbi:LysR family transcriptional regulator [Carnobacterium gallinarum]|uniref:LysR family transcriptional regulator n=1 Tax=Carnobacterium gallinarum TaxID=2749 RepID=UPI0005544923|nr:LysR family transcriptional regulator [Carnobacterium gallinarum]